MAFYLGNNSVVLINDTNASAYLSQYSASWSRDVHDVTTFADTGGRKGFPGIMGGSVSFSGFWDQAVLDPEVGANLGTVGGGIIQIAPVGFAIGNPVELVYGDIATYDVPAEATGMVTVNVNVTADDGVNYGKSLHALATESTSTNSASVDHGAASANGAVAFLNCTANSRNGNTTIVVQDSANDTDFTTIGSFAVLGAATTGQERVTVSGAVRRYVRCISTLAGSTGTVTYTVGIARR